MYLWFPVVLMGYVFAEFQLFERAKEYISNRTRTTILCTTLVFLALIGRFLEPSIRFRFERIPELKMNLDVLYAPMFIFAIVTLFEKRPFKHMRGVLSVIGKYSMMMWFLSCIFFNNSKTVFQPILYAVKNPILVLIWGCILCLIPAFFLTKLVRIFTDLKNSVLFHKDKRRPEVG